VSESCTFSRVSHWACFISFTFVAGVSRLNIASCSHLPCLLKWVSRCICYWGLSLLRTCIQHDLFWGLTYFYVVGSCQSAGVVHIGPELINVNLTIRSLSAILSRTSNRSRITSKDPSYLQPSPQQGKGNYRTKAPRDARTVEIETESLLEKVMGNCSYIDYPRISIIVVPNIPSSFKDGLQMNGRENPLMKASILQAYRTFTC